MQPKKSNTRFYDEKILYHFCAKKFLPNILKIGLRFGQIPYRTKDKIFLLPSYQWLTINSDWNQTWNEFSTLPYDRTECRLEIHLPSPAWNSLKKWTEFNQQFPNLLYDALNAFGDFENWYLFNGVVIPHWIFKIEKKSKT